MGEVLRDPTHGGQVGGRSVERECNDRGVTHVVQVGQDLFALNVPRKLLHGGFNCEAAVRLNDAFAPVSTAPSR